MWFPWVCVQHAPGSQVFYNIFYFLSLVFFKEQWVDDGRLQLVNVRLDLPLNSG
ncbi:hypothetical protein K661_01388 [Piscirickettsia salmonis LF-89 = ATCC VR-1361]|nr:hypothetical protein K661_01388 [Piscirickettsia salmonis LF-89 = ATCC VR-1361]